MSCVILQQEAGPEAKTAPQTRQQEPEPESAPANAAALNAKAEAAAAQPLPDSDDSDNEDALGVVKGMMRKESPKENGAIANEKPKVAYHETFLLVLSPTE